MAFKKSKPYKEPHLTPADRARIAELEKGGKNSECKACHFKMVLSHPKFAAVEMTMYGKDKEEIIEKAKGTLKVLNSIDGKWKITETVNLKSDDESASAEEE